MKRLNNAGFSLVELMVVVAIIGILAAVAIPNYTKFQRRARAAEGKAMLSSLYDAEKSAYASYEGYTVNFVLAGFTPEGMALRTNVGFSSGTDAAGTTDPKSTATGEINALALTNAESTCSTTCFDATNFCTSYKDGAGRTGTTCHYDSGAQPATTLPAAVAGTVSNTTTGAETFSAGSDTNCGGTKDDQWNMLQNKSFTQIQDCSTGT